jgi:hypothetical protein
MLPIFMAKKLGISEFKVRKVGYIYARSTYARSTYLSQPTQLVKGIGPQEHEGEDQEEDLQNGHMIWLVHQIDA